MRFIKRLRHRCNELAQSPGIGRRRDEIKRGYRSVSEGDYLIFYSISDEQTLEIVRVIHAKRDLDNIEFSE